MAKRYESRPVIIEAMLFDGTEESSQQIGQWINECKSPQSFVGFKDRIEIKTLEGTMTVSPGDYVIRGLANEFYPCKPHIFLVKYKEYM